VDGGGFGFAGLCLRVRFERIIVEYEGRAESLKVRKSLGRGWTL